jgi:hypothetical protein
VARGGIEPAAFALLLSFYSKKFQKGRKKYKLKMEEKLLLARGGIEPAAFALLARRSNQLS